MLVRLQSTALSIFDKLDYAMDTYNTYKPYIYTIFWSILLASVLTGIVPANPPTILLPVAGLLVSAGVLVWREFRTPRR